MYGGLFGDLPAAKKSSAQKEADGDGDGGGSSGAAAPTSSGNGPAAVAVSSSSAATLSNEGRPAHEQGGGGGATSSPRKPSQPAAAAVGSSILKTLGSQGTSMAFVPTAAALQKKRQRAAAPASSSVLPPPSTRTKTAASLISTTTVTTIHPVVVRSVHETETSGESSVTVVSSKSEQTPCNSRSAGVTDENDEDAHRELRQKELDDPYDPLVPNDLLQYWERKAIAKQTEQLERERREAAAQQERLREQLERERRLLEEQGDANKLAEHHLRRMEERRGIGGGGGGRGRGRGRGVSNLPAWLVEKQRKENEQLGSSSK